MYAVIGRIFLRAGKDKTSKYFSGLFIFSYKHLFGHIDSHIVNFNRSILLEEFIRLNIRVSNVWSFSEHTSNKPYLIYLMASM